MLTFDNVSVRQQDTLILEHISFTINPGEIAAIHCGVTSREILFALLTNTHTNYSGTIDTANRTLSLFSIRDGLYDRLTVEEYLRFTHTLYESTESLDAVLQTVQLTPYRNKRLNRLSLSLVRRVQYAALLLHNRDIYVLEEPDQNVDQETRHLFATVLMQLKQQQKAILLLTSNMESALFVTSTVYRIDHRHLRLLDVEPDEPDTNEDVTPEVMHVRFEKIPTKVNEKIVLLESTGNRLHRKSGWPIRAAQSVRAVPERLHDERARGASDAVRLLPLSSIVHRQPSTGAGSHHVHEEQLQPRAR